MSDIFEVEESLVDEIDEAEPLRAAPGGQYGLRIDDYNAGENGVIRTDKNGRLFILPMLEIYGSDHDDEYKSFSHYVPLPNKDKSLSGKQKRQRFAAFKNFCEAFNIDWRERIDWKSTLGNSAEGIISDPKETEYGPQNSVVKFV